MYTISTGLGGPLYLAFTKMYKYGQRYIKLTALLQACRDAITAILQMDIMSYKLPATVSFFKCYRWQNDDTWGNTHVA